MEPSEIKTYLEIVEIVFKTAAMVVAGVWAVYGLIVFRRRQAAITQLRKAEAEAASLELEAKRRAVLDISIDWEALRDPASSGFILTIKIVIANAGVASALMQFDPEKPSVRVQRLAFDHAGQMTFPEPPMFLAIRNASDPTRVAGKRVIRAGGISRLTSVLRVDQAGVYAISFRVPMDDVNRQAMIEAGANSNRQFSWSMTSFACVGLVAVDSPASPLPT